LTIKIKNFKAFEFFNTPAASRALKLFYVNTSDRYFTDNELVAQPARQPLTIEKFMARFFNYYL
jgi:hypothetical protein